MSRTPSASNVQELPAYQSILHPAQLKVIAERKRFNVVCCGRRWGKTELGKDIAVESALAGYPVGWFAPEYKYLTEVWQELNRSLKPYITRSNATERRIELITGGLIEMWSLETEGAGRSRKYARVIIDEAAMVADMLEKWLKDIRATLTDLRGDAWFLSTPKGLNDFWQLWTRGQDELEPEWMSWQMPTSTNPFIPADEIEAAKQESPEDTFQQEYLAIFLASGAVFSGIHEAATAKPQGYAQDGYPSHPKHTYVVGVDWGKYEDYSVFAVVDATTKELCYLDRSNHIDYIDQLKRLEDICKRFQVSEVVAESNSQATTMELMHKAGLPVREFVTSNISKHNIIDALRNAVKSGKLRILKEKVLLEEMQSFIATRLPGGGLRFAASKNYHDDCVMALALAWDAAKDSTPMRIIRPRR